jgi:hypothetical protein
MVQRNTSKQSKATELVGLRMEDFQLREEHWVIADLLGKARHVRTVPVPA